MTLRYNNHMEGEKNTFPKWQLLPVIQMKLLKRDHHIQGKALLRDMSESGHI